MSEPRPGLASVSPAVRSLINSKIHHPRPVAAAERHFIARGRLTIEADNPRVPPASTLGLEIIIPYRKYE